MFFVLVFVFSCGCVGLVLGGGCGFDGCGFFWFLLCLFFFIHHTVLVFCCLLFLFLFLWVGFFFFFCYFLLVGCEFAVGCYFCVFFGLVRCCVCGEFLLCMFFLYVGGLSHCFWFLSVRFWVVELLLFCSF